MWEEREQRLEGLEIVSVFVYMIPFAFSSAHRSENGSGNGKISSHTAL